MKINVNKSIKWAMRHWKTLLAVFVTGCTIAVATENEYQKGLEDGSSANAEGFKRVIRKKAENDAMTEEEVTEEYLAGAQQYFDETYGK